MISAEVHRFLFIFHFAVLKNPRSKNFQHLKSPGTMCPSSALAPDLVPKGLDRNDLLAKNKLISDDYAPRDLGAASVREAAARQRARMWS